MSVVLPRIRVGEPVGYQTLMVFPLFDGAFELVGAKQNRILNTSVLIAAHGKTKIPVSCVEQGRWSYRSRRFDHGGRHSSSKLRRVLKKSVHDSLQAKRGHRSNQGQVWHEVSRQQQALNASSETRAMSDTYLAQQHRLAEFRERLQYVEGACGLAVAVGGKVVALDLFNRADTCRKVWQRLLSGYVLDALKEDAETEQPNAADVEQLLETVVATTWQQSESVGEGGEYRANLGEELHGSALTLGNSPVHVSVIVG